jgi:hypothetical protein
MKGSEPAAEKQIKPIAALAVLVVILSSAAVVWYGVRKVVRGNLNPVRPDGFPEALIAPEYAYSIDYSTPSNTTRAPHTYGLCFLVDEPYPAEKVCSFLERTLKSQGWQRLKYWLMAPRVLAGEWYLKRRPDGGKIHAWSQYWVNDTDDTVSAFLAYPRTPQDDDAPNTLFVSLIFFEKESWVYSALSTYKQVHPEEFDQTLNLSEPNETKLQSQE